MILRIPVQSTAFHIQKRKFVNGSILLTILPSSWIQVDCLVLRPCYEINFHCNNSTHEVPSRQNAMHWYFRVPEKQKTRKLARNPSHPIRTYSSRTEEVWYAAFSAAAAAAEVSATPEEVGGAALVAAAAAEVSGTSTAAVAEVSAASSEAAAAEVSATSEEVGEAALALEGPAAEVAAAVVSGTLELRRAPTLTLMSSWRARRVWRSFKSTT
jgi:hypothetical protein